MGYHPRIETEDIGSLATSKSRNGEIWLINNKGLEEAILGYAAKFSDRYQVELYALAMEGNHAHSLARFPLLNRAHYFRDFNSCVAKAVQRHVPSYPGGSFWARRYSSEFAPGDEDIEEKFFYVVLQAVNDGLVDHPRDYPGYNCFEDAISDIPRPCTVIDWAGYNNRKRFKKDVDIKDYTHTVELKFRRLPGYELLSTEEYQVLMREKLEQKRLEAIEKRNNKPSFGAENIEKKTPGAKPVNPKTSKRFDHRPRMVCKCPIRRETYNKWYFAIYYAYKEASRRYRNGELDVEFPPGTYRPPSFTCKGAQRPTL